MTYFVTKLINDAVKLRRWLFGLDHGADVSGKLSVIYQGLLSLLSGGFLRGGGGRGFHLFSDSFPLCWLVWLLTVDVSADWFWAQDVRRVACDLDRVHFWQGCAVVCCGCHLSLSTIIIHIPNRTLCVVLWCVLLCCGVFCCVVVLYSVLQCAVSIKKNFDIQNSLWNFSTKKRVQSWLWDQDGCKVL